MAEGAVSAVRPVLVLRPAPGAQATAAAARALGLHALVVPLFETAPLDWTPPEPDRFDAVMLTSANALRHGGPDLAHYHHLPAYAVGSVTGAAARAAGFADVRDGRDDVAALIDAIARAGREKVLHLCGRHRRAVDPGPVTLETVPIYAARIVETPSGLESALARGPVALVHSTRAGARLAALTDAPARSTVDIAAISRPAAEAAGAGWQAVAAAAAPSEAALLALARNMCETGASNSR